MSIRSLCVGRRISISRLGVALLYLALWVSVTGWRQAGPFLEHSLSFVGWVLVAIGVMGRIWCSSHIGGKKNSVLVTVGPYSVSRNPLYFCSFLAGLGVALVTETLTVPIVFCLLFALYYSKVISAEEETLLAIYGAEFEAYCARVPRFWPQFGLLCEPASYLISGARLQRSLMDSAWFIIAGGSIEFLEGLHISGYLPVYFQIY